jgi:polyferredoxin
MSKSTFFCDCGINGTKPVGRPHETKVDKDDVCIHCGHYAQAKKDSVKKYNTVTDPDENSIGEDYHSHIDVESLVIPDT